MFVSHHVRFVEFVFPFKSLHSTLPCPEVHLVFTWIPFPILIPPNHVPNLPLYATLPINTHYQPHGNVSSLPTLLSLLHHPRNPSMNHLHLIILALYLPSY